MPSRARGPHVRASALLAFALLLPFPARAEAVLDLGALARAAERSAPNAVPRPLRDSVSVVLELPDGAPAPDGFVSIAGRLGVLDLRAGSLFALARERPELRLEWAPSRRLLMNRADGFARASRFRRETGLTGRGVVVGIVDSGVDPAHPDLRDETGRSRIAWWLDFSRGPAGRHPELEAELGCVSDDGEGRCAVLDGGDVEELLFNGEVADDPGDALGHGTHVASLAGGNGLSFEPPRYVGVAPQATFIVVRAMRPGGGIFDADILKAARFVFERAGEASMPAVVNLSLGSDFGGHDGSSGLERGLESLVGPAHPGRAIVVAAGNSAGLFDGVSGVPGPCGVHTEVHLPHGEETVVPIATLTEREPVRATVYAWIATRPGDALSVGVVDPDGVLVEPIAPGNAVVEERDGVTVSIANSVAGGEARVPAGSEGAVVVIEGAWPSSRTFGLWLEGPGSARIWVLGEGDLDPSVNPGPLLPRARKEGTVNVPASSPGLIAVGATLNRTDWVDHAGEAVSFPRHGSLDDAPADTTAFFSSAGPNALGTIKPDLVASGANVVGALAVTADPRFSNASFFATPGACRVSGYDPNCVVVDDHHVVSSGTSMAAPLVAGAVALLFERDPTLDQGRVRALLQAGARELEGVVFDERQVGPGALDLQKTLDAFNPNAAEREPGEGTRLVLGASFAHPDPTWPLEGLLLVRGDSGRIADVSSSRLSLVVNGADVVRGLTRSAPGLFSFALAAPAGSGGRTLSVALRVDGRTLVERSVPIAVDPALVGARPSARGGCAMVASGGSPVAFLVAGLAALLALRRRGVARFRWWKRRTGAPDERAQSSTR
ncbi:MAG TPA: S8 family serine peptidase [Polyangiaceae bacterium]